MQVEWLIYIKPDTAKRIALGVAFPSPLQTGRRPLFIGSEPSSASISMWASPVRLDQRSVAMTSAGQTLVYAWALNQRIAHSCDRRVLLALAQSVPLGTYVAAPGVAAISAVTGLDRKMIRRSLIRLQNRGLINFEGRSGRTNQRHAYRLAVLGIGREVDETHPSEHTVRGSD